MDDSAEEFELLESGGCNFCSAAKSRYSSIVREGHEGGLRMAEQIRFLKETGKGKEYDAVIGLSGGVDSSYAALLASRQGLRLLAVHCDAGWNSEIAVGNIKSICSRLNIHLVTVVVNWEEMRDAQAAFFRASVPNCDIPQDHAILASNNRVAAKFGIRNFISGGNYSCESIIPASWVYDARDLKHLRAVTRKFSGRKLRDFPQMSWIQGYLILPFLKGVRSYRILNDIEFDKDQAKAEISEELGWKDYGGKHHESVYTKFFQSYYLPEKFGIDKRKAHLSSMIVSGQIDRSQALAELQKPLFDPKELDKERKFFLKKLRLSREDWAKIMESPTRRHQDYPNWEKWSIVRRRIQSRIEENGIILRKNS